MSLAIPAVYLSSTKEDLIEYRAAVLQQIASMSLHGVSMETANAEERPPLESCLRGVKRSDVYVGIFAHRYGFIPPNQNQSITELEYRAAGEAGVDRLIFLLHEDHPWKPSDSDAHTGENDHGLRIQRLRDELRLLKTVQFFTTPEDLARKVAAALHTWTYTAHEAQATRAGTISSALRAYLDDCVSKEQQLDRKYIFLSGTGERPVLPSGGFPLHLVPRSFRVIRTPRQPEMEVELVPTISDVLKRYPQVVIVGEPGSGKSTTLHYLHLVKAQQALDGSGSVPIYINLAEWPESVPDLKSLLVHERDIKGCPSIPASRLLLLLDGLNEMRERDYDAHVESIQQWLVDNQAAQVVVTARKQQYVQNRQLHTATVTIHPLTDSQVELFVAKYLGAEDSAGLLASIGWETRHNADARHFARLADNPFQLALLCYVYSESGKTLPSTRGELLRILAQTVYQREADLGNNFGLTYDDMQAGLGELALAAVQARSSTAIDDTWAAKWIPQGIDVARLRSLGVDTRLIRLSKNDRFIQFSHQLVLEYFAAERLSNDLKRVSGIVRKPRFQHGERRAQATDEVCFTLAELHGDLGAALSAIAHVDPFLAVDALTESPRAENLTVEQKETLAQQLVDARSVDGERERGALVNRLGVLGDAAVTPLAGILRHGSKPERRLAVEALAIIGSLDAVDQLVVSLQDRDRWVRREAREALRGLREIQPDLIATYVEKRLDKDTVAHRELRTLLAPKRKFDPVFEASDPEIAEPETTLPLPVRPIDMPGMLDVAEPETTLPLPARPIDMPGMLDRAATIVAEWRAITRRLIKTSKNVDGETGAALDDAVAYWAGDLSTETLLSNLAVASARDAKKVIATLVLRGTEALFHALHSPSLRNARGQAMRKLAKHHAPVDADTIERLLGSPFVTIRQAALSWLMHADAIRGFDRLVTTLKTANIDEKVHAASILVHLIEQVEDKTPTAVYSRMITTEQCPALRERLDAKRNDLAALLGSILTNPSIVNGRALRDQPAIALYLLLEREDPATRLALARANTSMSTQSAGATVGES